MARFCRMPEGACRNIPWLATEFEMTGAANTGRIGHDGVIVTTLDSPQIFRG